VSQKAKLTVASFCIPPLLTQCLPDVESLLAPCALVPGDVLPDRHQQRFVPVSIICPEPKALVVEAVNLLAGLDDVVLI